MNLPRILLLALVTTGALFAETHPAEQIDYAFPSKLTVAPGRSVQLRLTLNVPKNHHIYLKHANKNGHAILTEFSVPGDTGFQLTEIKRPRGMRVGNEYVLRARDMFVFELSELAMHEAGSIVEVPLKAKVQICEEGEGGVCYMPVIVTRTLQVTVAGAAFQTRDLPDASLPWVNHYDTALKQAKLKNQNIFALISDPSRCGACAYLEKKIFPDANVHKMLQTKFVLYRVPRNEYGHAPISGSFGIPFYFIVTPAGDKPIKWMGAPNATGFVKRLEPYVMETAPAAPQVDGNFVLLEDGKCKAPLRETLVFQASQKGSFASAGNLRIVANASEPGTYTVLTLDRTGEIFGSHNAKVTAGKLQVTRYLGGTDLIFSCSKYGIVGSVAAQGLEMNIEIR